MKTRGVLVAAGAAVLLAAGAAVVGQSPRAPKETSTLPALGAELPPLPPGPIKAMAEQACLHCHSSDMIRQQRLTEKQWTTEVNKMIGWGAVVPDDQKDALVAYFVEHFGPDNDGFRPIVARPGP